MSVLNNSPFLCNLLYAFESEKELFLVMPFCLLSSSPVPLADGTVMRVGDLKHGDMIFTEDNEVTMVTGNKLMNVPQMIEINSEGHTPYLVTPEHRLVFRWAHNPVVAVNAPLSANGWRFVTIDYHDKDDKWKQKRMTVLKYRLPGDPNPVEQEDDGAPIRIAGLLPNEDAARAIGHQILESDERFDRDGTCLYMGDIVTMTAGVYYKMWTAPEPGETTITKVRLRAYLSPLPPLKGAIVDSSGGASSSSAPPSSICFTDAALVDDLRAQAIAAGKAAAKPEQVVVDEWMQTISFAADGSLQYGVACEADFAAAKVVYMLHNPLVGDTFLDKYGNRAFAIKQLDRAWHMLKLHTGASSGIIVTELNPIATETNDMDSREPEYDEVCKHTMRMALEVGTSTIIAFGASSPERWKGVAKLLGGDVSNLDSTRKGVVAFSYKGRAITVFTTLHPCMWSHWSNVLHGVANAHMHAEPGRVIEVPDAEKVFEANSAKMLMPKLITAPKDEPFEVAVMAVSAENHTYVQANGVVTHNCHGGDLRFHLKERGTMPVSTCLYYACEMIMGLQAMHEKRVVFRGQLGATCHTRASMPPVQCRRCLCRRVLILLLFPPFLRSPFSLVRSEAG
jgi:hypothetical protein